MPSSVIELVRSGRLIDVGERSIVRASIDYGPGKPRFVINLPTTRNDLWGYLWKQRIKVKVYIEISGQDQRGVHDA
jgi:hypothetical protein